jgi:RNA polymerase-binding transcription factor DksA
METVMANGWAPDGAVQPQIEDSVKDALNSPRTRIPSGMSRSECEECGEPVPDARQRPLPGVRICIVCQTERDK